MTEISADIARAYSSIAWQVTPAVMAAHLTQDLAPHERFQVPRHIEFISNRIAWAVSGAGPKFMIVNMPPQNGKSHLVSTYTPVWYLERFPHRHLVLGAYASDFAARWGRRAREIIERHSRQLTVRLSASTTAADEWETSAGGGMLSTGVGGGTTGRPADGLIIIDDPYKDSREANSSTIRENIWDWFTTVALTRRHPETVVLLIHTRWHEDDLTGRILKRMETDPSFPRFDVLSLPAIAEENDPMGREVGAPLWPEKYDLNFIEQQRRFLGSYAFNALYQQRPASVEGGYFQRAWFDGTVDRVPPGRVDGCVRAWDLAATVEGQKGNGDPDWTVGMKMTRIGGVTYLDDMIRVRATPAAVERLVRNTAEKDGHAVRVRMQKDPGQAGSYQVSHYARRILDGWDFRGIHSTADKVTRAGAFNAACERGDVRLVAAAWNDSCVEEMASFPTSKHDDIVDACSIGFNDLATGMSSSFTPAMSEVFSYRRPTLGRNANVMELLEATRRPSLN